MRIFHPSGILHQFYLLVDLLLEVAFQARREVVEAVVAVVAWVVFLASLEAGAILRELEVAVTLVAIPIQVVVPACSTS